MIPAPSEQPEKAADDHCPRADHDNGNPDRESAVAERACEASASTSQNQSRFLHMIFPSLGGASSPLVPVRGTGYILTGTAFEGKLT
jgi:hypothetical protein